MNESSTVREVKIDEELWNAMGRIGFELSIIEDKISKDELANLLIEMKDVYSRLDIAWRKA